MTASRATQERRLAELVGPLGRAAVHVGKRGQPVYKVSCRAGCTLAGGRINWTTHRSDKPNDFLSVADRWTLHLHFRHPEADAPCLAYLDDALGRRDARHTERSRP